VTKPRPTHRERTERAFAAYLELVETAQWIVRELSGPLNYFELTMNEFRLLFLLYREGPMSLSEAAKKRALLVGNLSTLVARLEKFGWLRREIVWRAPVERRASKIPRTRRERPRRGPRFRQVSLTSAGERKIESVIPRQAKLVKSLMRTLDMREQDTLGRLCRKLREEYIVKFIREIRMEDAEEDLMV